jgi:hypothetical protein
MTETVLDKVVLKTGMFDIVPDHTMTRMTVTQPGQDSKHRYFYNGGSYSIEVRPDKQGYPAAFVTYNPAKLDRPIEHLCSLAGVHLDTQTANVLRLDIARDKRLSYGVEAYHQVLRAASGGHNRVRTFAGTITTGNNRGQLCLYDKSKESKLPDPGICRLEVRYLKPVLIRQLGIQTLHDLTRSDLFDLYCQGGKRYLPNLNGVGLDSETIGNGVALLQHLYATNSRPLTTFLSVSGILALGGTDAALQVLRAANLPKQKFYLAKQQIMKLGDISGQDSSTKHEILQYFAA